MNPVESLFQQLQSYSAQLVDPLHYTDDEVRTYWDTKILAETIYPDTFYTILDYRTLGFSYVHGVAQALGLSRGLTIPEYIELVHPEMLELYILWGMEALEMAQNYKSHIEPFKFIYRIALPLHHANGTYYWAFQNSTPLQIDKNNQIISQLNTYRIGVAVNEGEVNTIKGEIFAQKTPSDSWNDLFLSRIGKKIVDIFTKKELQLLKEYAAGNHHTGKLAKKLGMAQATLYTHNKNICGKATNLFRRGFHNAVEVADYLKNNDYLPKDT